MSGVSFSHKHNVIKKMNRRRKVEKYMKRGVTNQFQIAAALGVSQGCISVDMQAIMDDWLEVDPATTKRRRRLRVQQLEAVAQEAWNGFDRSRKDSEKLRFITRICTNCSGIADDPDDPACKVCGGKGTVTETTSEVHGQAGDPAFLKIVKDCLTECAKMEGLYPKKKGGRVKIEAAITQVVALPQLEGNPYKDTSVDKLLQVRHLLSQMDGSEVIDAVSVEGGDVE